MDSVLAEQLKNYIEEQVYPDGYTDAEKRRLREKAARFIVSEKKRRLYWIEPKSGERRRVVIGEAAKLDILHAIHSDVGGGHYGQNNTWRKIKERYWWKGIVADVQKYRKTCDRCQRQNPDNKPHPDRCQRQNPDNKPQPGKQRDGYNCGVYAVAFAAELLAGGDPTKVLFDAAQLRPHLLQCFADKKLSPFPSAPRKALRDAKIDVIFI